MPITGLFGIDEIKRERDSYKAILQQTQRMEVYEAEKLLAELSAQREKVARELEHLQKEVEERKKDIISLDDEILLQSFGLYKPHYSLENSEAYKRKLEEIREKQARMVKGGTAASSAIHSTVNYSETKGKRMTKDNLKLIVRSFNNECDASIGSLKFNNIVSIEKKITKAHETLNKLGKRMSIAISREYLSLKLQELYLVYEYQVKMQEEKAEQKRLREKRREESKPTNDFSSTQNKPPQSHSTDVNKLKT